MSIQVVAVVTAKPGSEDVVRGALGNLVEATRAEDGNLSYELNESLSAPGTFVTVEQWGDPSDLEKHLATDHMAQALADTADHLAGPPAIHALAPIAV